MVACMSRDRPRAPNFNPQNPRNRQRATITFPRFTTEPEVMLNM